MSLIEILVAMTILAIILGVLAYIVGQIQKVVSASRAQTEIYEQARILFDLIGQDLQGLQASNQTGTTTYWTTSNAGLPSTMVVAFVSSSGIGSTSSDSERAVEVGYSYESDSSVVRWVTSQTKGTMWNYNNTLPTVWAASGSWGDSTVVASGVKSLTCIPYKDATTQWSLSTDSAAPAMFRVEFELYDPNALTDTVKSNSLRKFSKNIFIARGQ